MDWSKVLIGTIIVLVAMIFIQGPQQAADTVSGALNGIATFFNNL